MEGRVLVLGAGGMLGHDLVATAPAGVTLFPCTRAHLDITESAALAATLGDVRPEVVINAAAYTAVDRAEAERDIAMRVNGAAVGELGRAAHHVGARVIHFSTDYVFDGTATEPYNESGPTNPVNAYGASKLAGEQALQASGAAYLIIRTQWLFGAQGRSFPRTMWQRAQARAPSRVVCDQFGRPTYSVDLARATWQLVAGDVTGVIHVANAGVATWYDVATRVYAACGVGELVQPCRTDEFPTPARRPLRAVLDTRRAERVLRGPLPRWQEAIDRFLLSSPL
jgi:dTDP-4-dehydrorhamnose reductase